MSSGWPTVCPGRSRGTPNSTRPRAHRQVDATGQCDPAAVVAQDDLAGDAVSGDDPLVGERHVDVVRARAEQERHAGDEQDEAMPPRRPSTPPSRTRAPARVPPSPRAPRAPPRAARCSRPIRRRRRRRPPVRARRRPPHDGARRACAAAPVVRRSGDVREPVGAGGGRGAGEAGVGVWLMRLASLGGETSSRIWPMTASCVTPSNSASGCRIRRCASTGVGERLHVVGGDVGAPVRRPPTSGRVREGEGSAHADAQAHLVGRRVASTMRAM